MSNATATPAQTSTPLIGIVGYYSQQAEKSLAKMYVNRSYVDYFKNFGRVVLIDPSDSTIFPGLSLLVLPGGPDVNPARYGEFPSRFTQMPNLSMEWFDVNVLPLYMADKTPIFGICRG